MPRSFRRFLLSLVVAAVAMSCTSETANYQYALVQDSCAPWDGGAIQVTLANQPLECDREAKGEYLMLGVWRGLPIHAGQVVKFGSRENNGFASRCKKAGDCVAAESGEITFGSFGKDKGATGHYELHFRNGETVSGRFDAKWCSVRMFCG